MALGPDTIVALSSSLQTFAGEAQLALIRLSGPRAVELADVVFKVNVPEQSKAARGAQQPNVIHTLAEALQLKRWRRIPGRVLWRGAHELDAHVYLMPAPRSFTREDVAELHVPGLPWLVQELIDTLVRAGARLAQPGEFTRRAFEHGRISLEQAEDIGKLIASGSAQEARAHAQRLLSHAESRRQQLKAGLEDLLAQVELGLDFAHEDVIVIAPDELARRLNALRPLAEKWALESVSEAAEISAHGRPRVVLAGPTNAGKSSLFNALLKRDAAIVSAQRHTTRDAVEVNLALQCAQDTYEILLIDSAGSAAHNSRSAHELAAWDATKHALRCADVLLLLLDATLPLSAQEGLPALLTEVRALKPQALLRIGLGIGLVWTKIDLREDAEAVSTLAHSFDGLEIERVFHVSAKSGAGIGGLRDFLAARAAEISQRSSAACAAAGAAMRASARAAAEALARASEALDAQHGEDAVALELREALHACWQAEGIFRRHDAVTEAALDRIFAQFCVGK